VTARSDGAIVPTDSAPPTEDVVPFSAFGLRRLSSQAVWAVMDQALFAGSNLAINVLLARWLPGEEYGAFVTAYTGLLLVQIAHASLLIEPMLIFGADKHHASFSHYFEVLRQYHWRLMLVVSSGLSVVAMAIALAFDILVGEAVAGLAVTAPFILLSWLARRACYSASQPRLAALGGVVNMTVVVAGILLLTSLDVLTVLSAQLLVGGAALATTVCLVPRLSRLTSTPLAPTARRAVWSDHWRYARWSGATGACTWFHTFIYYLVLPSWGGLAASGGLKALMNLITPILHSDGALVTMLLPQFVRSHRIAGRLRRLVTVTASVFVVEAVVYWVLLAVFGDRVAMWLYGGAYRFDRSALLLVGAIPLFSSLVTILGNALRAREQPDGVFWATMAAVIVAGTAGVGAVAWAGLDGAVAGMVGSSIVQVVVLLWLLSRPTEGRDTSAPTANGVSDPDWRETMQQPDVPRVLGSSVPVVSAIMPTYNKGEYLAEAIDSILRQSRGDWELIIVDDGSTDETAAVLARYTDPRIVVRRLPANEGRSRARNLALSLMRGRYVALCDSDDISVPTRFEQQVAFLDAHPDVGVVSAYIRAFSNDASTLLMFPLDDRSIRRRLALGKMGVAHGASMVRAECFAQMGGYCDDLAYAEDLELFRRFAQRFAFRTLPAELLEYRYEMHSIARRVGAAGS
jgi:O-antigen/teichoic acid export membrane protein